MTNPFRATSPNPGFDYRKKEKPKTPSAEEIALQDQKLSISKEFELDLRYRRETKKQALKQLGKIANEMKSAHKPTSFIEEFYIQLYNNKQIGMDDLIFADKQIYKTYLNLNRDDAREIFDIDTGEPLRFTKAVWNPREGRLDVDMNGILKMSTGEFDIQRRAVNGQYIYVGSTPNTPKRLSPVKQRNLEPIVGSERPPNEIFRDFMERGPRTPIAHQYWSKFTGDVEMPEEEIEEFDDGQGMIDIASFRPTTSDAFDDESSNDLTSSILQGSTADQLMSFEENHKGQGSDTSARQVLRLAKIESARDMAGTAKNDGNVANKSTSKKNNPTMDASRGKKKKSHEKREKLPDSIVPDSIDPTNKKLWGDIEKKLYDELYEKLVDMEHNKFRTHEPSLPPVYIRDIYGKIVGQEESAKVTAKELAMQMMHAKRDVVQAIEDEEIKDAARKLVEDQCQNSRKLKEVMKKHDKERHDFRRYLRTLQYDNELVLINKMTKYGLLW